MSQSLWNRAGSFDLNGTTTQEMWIKSQSLWNRAGSFDGDYRDLCRRRNVSIPLEQGGVFRPCLIGYKFPVLRSQSLWNRAGSFDRQSKWSSKGSSSLNPFGTGRGLSTLLTQMQRVFTLVSQSLWNRAGSFDPFNEVVYSCVCKSQSLWNRAGSFDCRGGLVPWWIRLGRIGSQFFPSREK